MSRRFVAGETLDDAIAAARKCNELGMMTSLDYLGENVATTTDAQRAREPTLKFSIASPRKSWEANVSCKLTQMGLDLSPEFCEGLVLSVVERAAANGNFLRVDMEGSIYTQRTVELVKRIRARNAAIGTVIQSYLYRSEKDIQDLLAYSCRIRLCKGAYKETADVAFERKEDVDGNYPADARAAAERRLSRHRDTRPTMIGDTFRWAAEMQISKDALSFRCYTGFGGSAATVGEGRISSSDLHSVWE